MATRPQGGDPSSALALLHARADFLRVLLTRQPDFTLPEMQAELAEGHGPLVAMSTLWRPFGRHCTTRKKVRPRLRSEPSRCTEPTLGLVRQSDRPRRTGLVGQRCWSGASASGPNVVPDGISTAMAGPRAGPPVARACVAHAGTRRRPSLSSSLAFAPMARSRRSRSVPRSRAEPSTPKWNSS